MKAKIIKNMLAIPLIMDVYYIPEKCGHSCGAAFPKIADAVRNTPLESKLWYDEYYGESHVEFELPDEILDEEVLVAISKVRGIEDHIEVVLTMDEIAAKFNIPVSNLKIKKQ